jgi:signal transduction histidine kinase
LWRRHEENGEGNECNVGSAPINDKSFARGDAVVQKRVVDVALVVALAAIYVLAARLGLALDAVAGFATLVWAPTGISLAALLLFGYRLWPGIFIGATVANLLTGAPLAVALAIGVGNTAEALVGAYLLRRVPRFNTALDSVRDSVAVIVLAGVLATMISATVGVLSLYTGGIVTSSQLIETWRAWWVGDMIGALLVAPIILVWSSAPRAHFRHRWPEVAALGAVVVIVGAFIFFSDTPRIATSSTPFLLPYILFPVLIWAALRFGQRGALTATLGASAIAVAGTVLGHGPFVRPVLHESLLALQIFMAIVTATFLLLGATIAERRRAHEEARRAEEEAARANRAKSEFLAGMSHELRTPLNAIAGYGELLSTGVYGELNEKQIDAVARIQRNEQHLLGLIDDILSFAKVETGKVTLNYETVPVEAAFDAVRTLIQPELAGKNFIVQRDPVPPGLAVRADPKRLQQILANLLSNASKYTDDGGTIALGAERNGATVRLWVRDTGIGISEEELKRVFEPFFQAERGSTRRFSGIGLGLTIARDLARKMSGDVTLESKVGDGTTASVILPAA